MRILGSIYTFIVGILVLIPEVFNTPSQMLSYVILDDLVFPLRDFVEILMFSYMFFQQSNKRKNLDIINEKWRKSNNQLSKNVQSSEGNTGTRELTIANMSDEEKKKVMFTQEDAKKEFPETYKDTLDLGSPIYRNLP